MEATAQIGVLRSKGAAWSSMEQIKWRLFPVGGSVRITCPDSTIRIEFGNFTPTERDEIVAFLRDRIRDDRQTNWDAFHDHFIAPARERAGRERSAKVSVRGIHT